MQRRTCYGLGGFVFSFLTLFLTSPGLAGPPIHIWSQGYGDASYQQTSSVSIDASGAVVITGFFEGSINFGGGVLTSAGGRDAFVAKFDASGNHVWSKHFGDASGQESSKVATDPSGAVIITGFFSGSIDFGGGVLTSMGGNDVFVAKFDAAGNHVWSSSFGDGGFQVSNGVAVDPVGNVVIAGYFDGSVDFGGGALTATAGGTDVFVAEFDASGNHIWSNSFGDAAAQGVPFVTADASGNVLVTGYFWGSIDFGGGVLSSVGLYDMFLAKFDGSGTHLWSKRFGDGSTEQPWDLATDASGGVVVAGHFMGGIDFGGGTLTSAGGEDIFLVKLDAAGNHVWSRRFGDTSGQYAYGVAIDDAGAVTATGFIRGSVDFGGGTLTSAGNEDVFLARFDASGGHISSALYGDTDRQFGYDVDVDPTGVDIAMTGPFWGGVDFGGGTVTSGGDADVWLAQFARTEAGVSDVSDVGNDQGGQVLIAFTRSGFDVAGSSEPILQYEAFRRLDPLPAVSSAPLAVSGRMISAEGTSPSGWVFAGAVPAHGDPDYLMIAPTLADSTVVSGMYSSVFFIRAATANPVIYYDSAPDSGYSLDNLAPSAPLGLAYAVGTLSWDESEASDFDYFTVYGSNTDDFATASVISYTIGTTMDVQASPYYYYFATATDFSGNESEATDVGGVPVGIGSEPVIYVLSISAYPNPFNPSTTIRYTTAEPGRVTLTIHDARGAQVLTLVNEETHEGEHLVTWKGVDDKGAAVSSGVYFARIKSNGQVQAMKLVLLK